MRNKTKVSVIGLEGADMAMRVSNNDHGRYCHHNFVLFFEFAKPITASQRSFGMLMFSKVSVCPFTEGGTVSLVPCSFWGVRYTHPLP